MKEWYRLWAIKGLFIVFPCVFLLSARHPLHVSTSDISFNAKDQRLEIMCTIYTDDLEATLSRNYNRKADLSNPAAHKAMDLLVKKYLVSTLQIKINSKIIPMNCLGFEQEKEAVTVYLESGKMAAFKSIDVDNVILYDQYTDQMSIVHVTLNGQRKSHRLDYPDHQVSVSF